MKLTAFTHPDTYHEDTLANPIPHQLLLTRLTNIFELIMMEPTLLRRHEAG